MSSRSFDEILEETDRRHQRYLARPASIRILIDSWRWARKLPREALGLWWDLQAAWQRARLGYDGADVWNHCHSTSRRAAKTLPKLKDRGVPAIFFGGLACMQSVPVSNEDLETEEQLAWNAALDDMIFFHTVLAGDYEEPLQAGERYPNNPTSIDEIRDPEAKHRARRGRYFYFKYYEGLWD